MFVWLKNTGYLKHFQKSITWSVTLTDFVVQHWKVTFQLGIVLSKFRIQFRSNNDQSDWVWWQKRLWLPISVIKLHAWANWLFIDMELVFECLPWYLMNELRYRVECRREIPHLQGTMYYLAYIITTLPTTRNWLHSCFKKRTGCQSFMALNEVREVSATDWLSQIQACAWSFSVVEIPIKYFILYGKKILV